MKFVRDSRSSIGLGKGALCGVRNSICGISSRPATRSGGGLVGIDRSGFLASELHKAAVLQKLTVIGREAHPEVEWRDIVAFRNIAVHAYFAVEWDIVWATAREDIPPLRGQIAGILGQLG